MCVKVKIMQVAKVYKPFFNAKNRYAILYGGAGSGKSYATAQKLIMRTTSEAGHKFLAVRKVAATLRYSVFSLLKSVIEKEGFTKLFKINETNMEFTFLLNNNKIICKGLDDPEKIKSIDGITGIWIEEATELTEVETPDGLKSDFDQLDLRLRGETKHYKQIVLTFNPTSINSWVYDRFFAKQVEDTFILKTTYLQNPFIDPAYKQVMERLKKQNPEYYKIYALGEWGSARGLIYPDYKIVPALPAYYEDVFIGIDFGYNHAYAIVLVVIEKNNLYAKELIYEFEKDNKTIIQMFRQRYPQYANLQMYADSARPDLIKEWKMQGFRVSKANKNVFEGINVVKSFNIHITGDSQNLLREIKAYRWKQDKQGNLLDEPVKFNDDGMDAMRYALTPYIDKKLRPVSKSLKGL